MQVERLLVIRALFCSLIFYSFSHCLLIQRQLTNWWWTCRNKLLESLVIYLLTKLHFSVHRFIVTCIVKIHHCWRQYSLPSITIWHQWLGDNLLLCQSRIWFVAAARLAKPLVLAEGQDGKLALREPDALCMEPALFVRLYASRSFAHDTVTTKHPALAQAACYDLRSVRLFAFCCQYFFCLSCINHSLFGCLRLGCKFQSILIHHSSCIKNRCFPLACSPRSRLLLICSVDTEIVVTIWVVLI